MRLRIQPYSSSVNSAKFLFFICEENHLLHGYNNDGCLFITGCGWERCGLLNLLRFSLFRCDIGVSNYFPKTLFLGKAWVFVKWSASFSRCFFKEIVVFLSGLSINSVPFFWEALLFLEIHVKMRLKWENNTTCCAGNERTFLFFSDVLWTFWPTWT